MDNPLQTSCELPDEVITEILSRLPVKSLLKFKCVSKSWRSSISSRYFIKSHLQNSTKNTNFSRHRIISTTMEPSWRLELYSLPSLLCEQCIYSFHFDGEMDKLKRLNVAGSSDGLICILIDRQQFFLWNPATNESRKLPDFHAGTKNISEIYINKYGFGSDESVDDYKVFAVFSVIKSATRCQTTAKVYSLNSDSWKRLDFFEDDTPLDAEGKFASGKLHWSRTSGLNSGWDIVSFDLKSEVFGVVEQPSCLKGGFYPTLGVLDGCLCMLCDYCKTQLDVWVLTQYGVQDSWCKMARFPYPSDPLDFPFPSPLCVLPNGEVLFVRELAFLSYNPKKSWHFYPQILESDEYLAAEVYVESLVSLAPDGACKSIVSDGVSKRGKPRKNGRTNKKK